MMAQKRSTLNMPRLEMVKEPPVNSCGCSLFCPCLASQLSHLIYKSLLSPSLNFSGLTTCPRQILSVRGTA